MLRWQAEAFATGIPQNYRVLWRASKEMKQDFPFTILNSSQIRLVEWLPSQEVVLSHPHIKLFVTHGGVNSPQEALIHGVPLLVLAVMADQIDNANRISWTGAGISLPRKSFTSEDVHKCYPTDHLSIFFLQTEC